MAVHLKLGSDSSGRDLSVRQKGMAGLDCIPGIRHPVGYGATYKGKTTKAHERPSYSGQGW